MTVAAVASLLAALLSIVSAQQWYYCDADLTAPFPKNATGKTLRHVSIIHRHGARVPCASQTAKFEAL